MNSTRREAPASCPGRRVVASAACTVIYAALVAVAGLAGPALTAAHAAEPAASGTATAIAPVRVVNAPDGSRLQVDGRDFMVFGMNWDYVPIGENYMYSLWLQPDDIIEAALAREMPMLKAMGVNAIRQYVGVPPRWVKYIYERYGIYTVINHPMARYGYTLDGVWIPSVDYSNPRLRAAVKAEIRELVKEFRDTPGVLLWLLGNENNYGLTWTSFEIEALPVGEQNVARARYLYSLFGEAIDEIHAQDSLRPVAIANGDLQYIDLIAQECKGLDILGTNVYRGISARDLFQVVRDKLGVPVLFTEFGADAWNAREMREDQRAQSRYLIGQWREIYEQSAGKGAVGNAIGGLVFQWSDGWWKFGQESRLDIHDTNASWPNGGYVEDFVDGENNMNEEWWGICAKGRPDARGLFDLYPRAAYYALQRAWRLDPYAAATTPAAIADHFGAIEPMATELQARGDKASLATDALGLVRVSNLRIEVETVSTGGDRITTPESPERAATSPAFLGFDHQQSFYTDFEVRPVQTVTGRLSVNVLGHVAENSIDEIFYENRGRPKEFRTADGQTFQLNGIERVKVYQANVDWDDPWFMMNAFYRTGHTHWGYEGDFFGIYRDAYYGENVDIYNGEAPVGVEFTGKKALTGLKLAFGPQLWWGANPAAIVKYRRAIGPVTATAMYHEDLDAQSTVSSSFAIPTPPTRTGTLHLSSRWKRFGFEVGGIWSGQTEVGRTFQIAEEEADGSYTVLLDDVRQSDTFGARARVTWEQGMWHWYGQGSAMGLVADGGPNPMTTYTGWLLKDSGLGNQTNFLTGLAVNVGQFQIGPNFLWQKPIVGPVPAAVESPGRPRNILDDPFAVRANREQVAGELLLTYDPTPATWMWQWDNDVREDASLAASLGFVVRHLPTTMDVAIGILADGRTTFAFPAATPPRDLWEVRARVVSRLKADTRLVAHAYAGTGEPNGDSPRLIHRYGFDGRITVDKLSFESFVKIDDWGPYDYHRDFNLTYPLQLMGDASYALGTPRWFGFPQTRFGVRGLWRSLDAYSPRYDPDGPGGWESGDPPIDVNQGNEWEIRTYLHVSL